mmetsp:Transcript_28695/g.63195  ORF Transcript_28695/g.63195 Transcript_28695/m.63195 type:complete len:313 (+) Transcript_28695:99-1037(+)
MDEEGCDQRNDGNNDTPAVQDQPATPKICKYLKRVQLAALDLCPKRCSHSSAELLNTDESAHDQDPDRQASPRDAVLKDGVSQLMIIAKQSKIEYLEDQLCGLRQQNSALQRALVKCKEEVARGGEERTALRTWLEHAMGWNYQLQLQLSVLSGQAPESTLQLCSLVTENYQLRQAHAAQVQQLAHQLVTQRTTCENQQADNTSLRKQLAQHKEESDTQLQSLRAALQSEQQLCAARVKEVAAACEARVKEVREECERRSCAQGSVVRELLKRSAALEHEVVVAYKQLGEVQQELQGREEQAARQEHAGRQA